MTRRVKVVLDTNVYISGVVFGGTHRRIIELIRKGEIRGYISAGILLEVAEKLRDKFDWKAEQVAVVVRRLAGINRIVKVKVRREIVREDPSDNKIIECAEEGGVDY